MGPDVLAGIATMWAWLKATFAWSDALTLAVGVVTVSTASVAIVQSGKSRKIAAGAKAAADKANELAERAISTGEGANDLAREANQISRSANDLAQDAIGLSKQQDERETERHDVRWEGGFVRPGVYRLKNKGEDTAHGVVATVAYRDDELLIRADEVPGGDFLDFELPEARQEYLALRAQILGLKESKLRREQDRESAESDPLSVLRGKLALPHQGYTEDMQIQQLQMVTARVSEDVYWDTARGAPKEHKATPMCEHLGAEL